MADAQGERIARNEQAIEDLRADVADIRSAMRSDHHRLRELESAVKLMLEAQKTVQRAEERHYRRLEVRMEVLTAVLAIVAVVVSVSQIVLR